MQRRRLSNGSFRGLILAALAAGSCTLPAVAAQASAASATPTNAARKAATATTAHKTAGPKTAHTTPAKTATKTATPKTAHDAPAVGTSKKSAHTAAGKSSSHKKSTKVKGQSSPTPDRINEIQQALAKKGVLEGSPTGAWDDATAGATKKFQTSQGLAPTGKLDALTLQKLGLGSEIAGVAAPTPPPNAVNRLRNTSSLPAESEEQ